MPENHLENLFNYLKENGLLSEYESYEDFKAKKYGVGQDPKDTFQEFYDGLTKEEKESFDYMFPK